MSELFACSLYVTDTDGNFAVWSVTKYIPNFTGNLPQHHPSERHALDLAGSREQRGSAFELYRKPQIGNAGHHHNMR